MGARQREPSKDWLTKQRYEYVKRKKGREEETVLKDRIEGEVRMACDEPFDGRGR
jgi:hypothetical protein